MQRHRVKERKNGKFLFWPCRDSLTKAPVSPRSKENRIVYINICVTWLPNNKYLLMYDISQQFKIKNLKKHDGKTWFDLNLSINTNPHIFHGMFCFGVTRRVLGFQCAWERNLLDNVGLTNSAKLMLQLSLRGKYSCLHSALPQAMFFFFLSHGRVKFGGKKTVSWGDILTLNSNAGYAVYFV